MPDTRISSDGEFGRLQGELAAVVRQYRRAADASDEPAEEFEAGAVCDCIRRLLYEHLSLRVGMSSDEWVWLDGSENCTVEQLTPLEVRASGRLNCSVPESRRQWTEPFTAIIRHSASSAELSDYTIWLGNGATLLNLAKVRHLLASGVMVSPPAPARDNEWAYIFRMSD
jgi:hypothetical protein